ncbi:MAG: hypothetical protein AB4040_03395 [Synechococcus sp.]
MIEERVEAVVYSLLENHGFEEILSTLHCYAITQSNLAGLLEQSNACQQWRIQARALQMAQDVLSEQRVLAVAEGE